MVQNAYTEALLKMPAAENEAKKLRRFYDSMESYIRGLEAVGVSTDSYGSFLLPILLKKLPQEVTRMMMRQVGDMNIEDLRHLLKVEVEIREKSAMGIDISNRDSTGRKLNFNYLTAIGHH